MESQVEVSDEELELIPESVVMRLGVARYAVPMLEVAEVVPIPAVTRVPGMPGWLAGVVNWRGHVLPVVDLRPVLGEVTGPLPSSSRVVVLTRDSIEIGLIVELITGLLPESRGVLMAAPSTISPQAAELVLGVVEDGGYPISLLDAGAIAALRTSLPSTRRSA